MKVEIVVCVWEIERTAMIYTISSGWNTSLGYLASLSFFHKRLIQCRDSTSGPPAPSSRPTTRWHDLSTFPNWPQRLKTFIIIYFLDAHTFFLLAPLLHNSSHIIHVAFPLFLVYLKTLLHILFLKSTLTGLSICNINNNIENSLTNQSQIHE